MSVGSATAPGAAAGETINIGSTRVAWSPEDGGTATVSTPEKLHPAVVGGVGLAGLGGGIGLAVHGMRKSSAAKIAAREAGLGAAEVLRAGNRAGGRWAMAGAGVALAAMAGISIAKDWLLPRTTEQVSMSREQFDEVAEHKSMPETLGVATLVGGYAAGAVGAHHVMKALRSAPNPLRVGAGLATMAGLMLGTGYGAEQLYKAVA